VIADVDRALITCDGPPKAEAATRLVSPAAAPRVVRWTDHALVKAELLGVARADVETAVLARHESRRRNPRAADWLVEVGSLTIAYNQRDEGDDLAALVVTLWRRA